MTVHGFSLKYVYNSCAVVSIQLLSYSYCLVMKVYIMFIIKCLNITILKYFFCLDEVNRGGSRPFHRQLLQSVQRSAHLRVSESGTLRGETRFLNTSCLPVYRNLSLPFCLFDVSHFIIGTIPLEPPEVKCLVQEHNDSSNN